MLDRLSRKAACALIYCLAVALLIGAPSAMAQSTSSMTINGVKITVIGGGSQSVNSSGDGAEIKVDGYTVLATKDRVTVDGTATDLAPYEELTIEVGTYALKVLADGKVVAETSEIAGLTKAAENGDANALNDLGVRYLTGDGVAKDIPKALSLYGQAADKGVAVAQSNLAYIHWIGKLTEQDRAKAVRYAEQAAQQGNAKAQFLLGVAYETGDGVVRDDASAHKWYLAAAEGGHATAMNNVGAFYFRGQGTAQSDADAFKWYAKASEAGDVLGTSNLGYLYWKGRGTEKDLAKAEELLAKAAAAGNENAARNLEAVRAER